MDKTLLDFAMIASVIIGYFVGIALITSSFYKSRANNYLALSLFSMANLTLIEWLNISLSSVIVDILLLFRFDFLFAAALFTYFIIQIKHPLLKSKWYKWIYFPFIGSVIIEFSLYLLDLYGTIYDLIVFYIKDIASISLNIFLIFWSRKLIRNSNSISENKRHWLLRLNLFVICLIIILILNRVELHLLDSIYSAYVLWIFMSLFLWWILYYGVFRLQVIDQKEEIHNYLVSNKTASKPIKKKINSSTSSKIITQLYALMEDEELYKNPLLSRLDLAARLETSEGYLSQIINQEINKSVIQFVNEYRIEAAKNLLQDPMFNKYSIEAIGMEAGFKSKSAFYDVFKTSLEMSPGAYRKFQKTS
ncbi:helix-turn-helix domain-containing protein [Winogradskyella flava]|uniref:AraC family transcriptional regulator n=1 Tax=Winogradskyella flava TaxID=1884876 RepID=A0A842IQV6_9FLAO|nr:helix-turn-helix domain-containing protein [Winogradskyella flava]MBC2845105.1 AraC family transcriptional regulator [Winogradskyella flava]